jgi:hypothetical protein
MAVNLYGFLLRCQFGCFDCQGRQLLNLGCLHRCELLLCPLRKFQDGSMLQRLPPIGWCNHYQAASTLQHLEMYQSLGCCLCKPIDRRVLLYALTELAAQ